jgi:hypothetical protein
MSKKINVIPSFFSDGIGIKLFIQQVGYLKR